MFILQRVNGSDFLSCQRPGQHAVVRPEENIICSSHRDGFSLAANPRIDDRQMDSTPREEPIRGSQREGPGPNVAGGNLVRDVHYRGARLQAEDDSFHRSDKPVLHSKIRQQSNQAHSATGGTHSLTGGACKSRSQA